MARKQLTADQVLRKRAGTNTRSMVARILATYDRATADDIAAGESWYSTARASAADMAEHVGTVDRAAAIIAQLSPRTSWSRNVAAAWHLALTGRRLDGVLTANYGRAMVAAGADDPIATLNGPKVRAFAANILGDEDAVTVDVWAARIAMGVDRADLDLVLDRVGVYDATARAYRIAASKRGTTPARMQATTWVVVRGSAS